MTSLTSNISRAVADAASELAALRQEYDRLAKRKAQLEAFIANAEPLLPRKENALRSPERASGAFHIPTNEPLPIWKAIMLSINGKHTRFTVKDALAGLERIGRPIESANKFQIARAVLMRRPENFQKIGKGLFRVKEELTTKGAPEEAP